MHRTCREKLFESSPTSPSRTFERGRRRQRSVWGQVLSQIKITLCNRRRGGPCGGAEGDGSEDLHTEYGVKSLSKPRRGGGRGHYLNVRVILIADNGYGLSHPPHPAAAAAAVTSGPTTGQQGPRRTRLHTAVHTKVGVYLSNLKPASLLIKRERKARQARQASKANEPSPVAPLNTSTFLKQTHHGRGPTCLYVRELWGQSVPHQRDPGA